MLRTHAADGRPNFQIRAHNVEILNQNIRLQCMLWAPTDVNEINYSFMLKLFAYLAICLFCRDIALDAFPSRLGTSKSG